MDMERQTGSKLEKEYIKAVYYHLAYVTYMQSTCLLSHFSHVRLLATPWTVAWQASLFLRYAENIMQNAGLDEAEAGIKITGRNINNFRYLGDTTLMAESKEELKTLLLKVKEENEKAGLKLNIQK